MKAFIKHFFAVSNEINENTVIGMILLIATLCAIFIRGLGVETEAVYVLSGMTMACFGLSLKK
jgi:putative effector of murein hydrolase LrgA (UPF0299 family)